MNLLISFSARKDGNCDEIAKFLANDDDTIVHVRDLDIHGCANCDYECFADGCKYRNDEIYSLYDSMKGYQKVLFIVPMYCGNPASLYFMFHERSQDYFMCHEEEYENLIKKLFIIGVYGCEENSPDFLACFEKWFDGTPYTNHVLGIERHKYNLKLKNCILDVEKIKSKLHEFIHPTKGE